MISAENNNVFVSYHNKNREIALKIKKHLEKFDFSVFMAPDDIMPGTKSLSTIYHNIKNSVFLPIISKYYSTSKYADQELGIALGYEKPIIPICIDKTLPYGFLHDYQCVCCHNIDIDKKLDEITNNIVRMTNSGKEYVELLVDNLSKADSFESATQWAKKVKSVSHLSPEQISTIEEALRYNDQIHNSFMAAPIVKTILNKYK